MRERIIDANLNRLSEGLRVIEDVCRFGLDDAATAGPLKAFRHDVGRLRRAFGAVAGDLLSARDSLGDVGREVIKEKTSRAGLLEVLGASFGRVAESLRVLEEMGKLAGGEAPGLAKAMRYQSYELEKRLVPLFDRREKAARLRGLYLVMTEPLVGYEALAEAAVKAGVSAIQLREKKCESGAMLAMARRLRELTRGTRTLFFVNDRPDIARLSEADGLHLGQNDLAVAEARQIVGDRMLIGKSTHHPAQLAEALAEGADYLGIGPIFTTTSKENPDPVLGIRLAAQMRRVADRPCVAIGGLSEANLPGLLRAGFCCYALISHVGDSNKPISVMRRLKKLEKEWLRG